MKSTFKLLSAPLTLLLSTSSFAAQPTMHVITAPNCLIQGSPSLQAQIIVSNSSFALINTNDEGINKLIKAKKSGKAACGGFMDVTANWDEQQQAAKSVSADGFLRSMTSTHPQPANLQQYKIQYPEQVKQLLTGLNPTSMWDNLTTLTNFDDRYANSDNGVNAANWIKQHIEKIAVDNHRDDITVYTIATGNSYKQPSVIVKIGSSNAAGIVISAHMDTLNSSMTKKPGADDDGSGTATILEAARNLIASGMTFNKPIYFMWFSAEEEGMVGSGYVVKQFKAQHIPVDAVLHFDMTGFAYKNQPDMWLMQDYVNSGLNTFVEQLIKTYVKRPVQYSRCGYACSDHATWTQNGYAAAIAAEAAYENTNQAMHTSRDTMDKLSIDHMTDYAKLASAFAVELAEPTV